MQSVVALFTENPSLSYNQETSIVVKKESDLISTLDYLRDNKFSEFVAESVNLAPFNLKNITQIYRVLKNDANLIINISEVSEADFKKLSKILTIVGFENQSQQNAITNKIHFQKKPQGSSGALNI